MRRHFHLGAVLSLVAQTDLSAGGIRELADLVRFTTTVDIFNGTSEADARAAFKACRTEILKQHPELDTREFRTMVRDHYLAHMSHYVTQVGLYVNIQGAEGMTAPNTPIIVYGGRATGYSGNNLH